MEPGNFRIGRVGRAHNDYYEVALKDRCDDCYKFPLHKFKCTLCPGRDDYQMHRDASGMGELLSRGRGTCMGYLNNRFMVMLMIFMIEHEKHDVWSNNDNMSIYDVD